VRCDSGCHRTFPSRWEGEKNKSQRRVACVSFPEVEWYKHHSISLKIPDVSWIWIWQVTYVKLLKMNSIFTWHMFLKVGQTQDKPSKIWQMVCHCYFLAKNRKNILQQRLLFIPSWDKQTLCAHICTVIRGASFRIRRGGRVLKIILFFVKVRAYMRTYPWRILPY
jgi:hypothetical protein